MKRPKAPNGSGTIARNGYRMVYRNGRGPMLEHRVLWEEAHGPIPEGFHIHHINGIKTDNRLENFEIVEARLHNAEHSRARIRRPYSAQAIENFRRAALTRFKRPPKPCSQEGCEKRAHGNNLCTRHYQQAKRGKLGYEKPAPEYTKPCSVSGCPEPPHARGRCNTHYRQLLKTLR